MPSCFENAKLYYERNTTVMILFTSDYCEGAHPRILESMLRTNLEQNPGYGEDRFCEAARAHIRRACGDDTLPVFFLVGGTQANLTVISAALRPHQGVLAAVSGHINVHETGAIEATGHKVLALPSTDGKLTAAQVRDYCAQHWNDETHEHIVQPKMVYISHPTEIGTLYSADELRQLRAACDACNLLLYLDGARLGYGLTAEGTDVTLPLLCECCDAFYIGGTKVGALMGEAVCMPRRALAEDFKYLIKQRGGRLAKGWLLGLQFAALFEDDLYWDIGRHANRLAADIRRACEEKGFPFLVPSVTNQQFPILPDAFLARLDDTYAYSYWQRVDETHSAVRFCTSWATRDEDVAALCADILAL